MKDASRFFAQKRADSGRLTDYGFVRENDVYTYRTAILNGQFAMQVCVRESGVDTQLSDVEDGSEYVLHLVDDAQGAFVGSVRAAYEAVLADIRDRCFTDDVFQSDSAAAVIQYVRETYGTPLEFLWEKFPDSAVYRRADNRKWYALLLTVDRSKLGLDGTGKVEILDLRIAPEQMDGLIDHKRYFPGYHMNKKHWYTICLDGSVADAEIFRRIDRSFALAGKK